MAPNLHWPDTMFTFDHRTGVMFTCDAFGSHLCTAQPFDVSLEEMLPHYAFYYDCLMRPNAKVGVGVCGCVWVCACGCWDAWVWRGAVSLTSSHTHLRTGDCPCCHVASRRMRQSPLPIYTTPPCHPQSVTTALRKVKQANLEWTTIATGHGPMLRFNLAELVDKYKTWSEQTGQATASGKGRPCLCGRVEVAMRQTRRGGSQAHPALTSPQWRCSAALTTAHTDILFSFHLSGGALLLRLRFQRPPVPDHRPRHHQGGGGHGDGGSHAGGPAGAGRHHREERGDRAAGETGGGVGDCPVNTSPCTHCPCYESRHPDHDSGYPYHDNARRPCHPPPPPPVPPLDVQDGPVVPRGAPVRHQAQAEDPRGRVVWGRGRARRHPRGR